VLGVFPAICPHTIIAALVGKINKTAVHAPVADYREQTSVIRMDMDWVAADCVFIQNLANEPVYSKR
jgi:hypothetical protein